LSAAKVGVSSRVRRKLIILVAEDDPNDLELVRTAVMRNGTEVELHETSNGEEVIQYLQGEGRFQDRQNFPLPDLLLLDIKMPRVDGLEVLRWLHANPKCAKLPVVMLSGSGLEKDVEDAYRHGVNTYFAKPSEFEEMQKLIHALIEYWGMSELPRLSVTC
jgi:CheY-like chemotaxis protein